MTNPTLIMPQGRELAHAWLDAAPDGVVVQFRKPGRTLPQNARMWAMLTDIAQQAEHNGNRYSPETWKALFMHACGHEVRFLSGLNGEPFPAGFRSSKLTKEQMGDLMEFMAAWGAKNGVRFKEDV